MIPGCLPAGSPRRSSRPRPASSSRSRACCSTGSFAGGWTRWWWRWNRKRSIRWPRCRDGLRPSRSSWRDPPVKFRSTERDSPEISLTPLIDVVFLLLIFFMVSTTFEQHSELGNRAAGCERGCELKRRCGHRRRDRRGGERVRRGPSAHRPATRTLAARPRGGRGRTRFAAGGDRRRCADTAPIGRHGHGRGAPGGALQADLRSAAVCGAACTTARGAAELMCCASDLRPLRAALRLRPPLLPRRRNP